MPYFWTLLLLTLMLGCSDEKSSRVETKVQKEKKHDSTLHCLKEKNTLTCKLLTKRVDKAREIEFEWKSPSGHDDRERKLVLPPNHASVYDARSVTGREKGLWYVEVEIDDGEELHSNFTL